MFKIVIVTGFLLKLHESFCPELFISNREQYDLGPRCHGEDKKVHFIHPILTNLLGFVGFLAHLQSSFS